MNCEFGDIIDCRKSPIEHMILIVGNTSTDQVMYFVIFSRIYTVFDVMLSFLNDCISKQCQRVFYNFNKEKGKQQIAPYGRLSDAFFLDKKTHYNLTLDTDSMILLNQDPPLMDKAVLSGYHKNGLASHKNKLARSDIYKLISVIKHSENIGPTMKSEIGRNYNRVLKKFAKST